MMTNIVDSKYQNQDDNSKSILGLKWHLGRNLGNYPDFYYAYREKAWQVFNDLSWPTKSDEPWRRTDIQPLLSKKFQLFSGEDSKATRINGKEESPKTQLGEFGGKVIIQNDSDEMALVDEIAKSGVIFTSLKKALEDYPTVVQEILGKIVQARDGKFSALVAAFEENGIFLYVPKNIDITIPLNGVIRKKHGKYAQFIHNILWIDEGSSVTYIHELNSLSDNSTEGLHAGITEILVGKKANLTYVEIQNLGNNEWNFTHEKTIVKSDGNIDWFYGSLGSKFSKNFIDVDLIGEGASTQMSGIYFTDGAQHIDLDTQQNHLIENTKSNLIYKGVLKDESLAIWQGMIFVAPGAQKTDGYQANRNLILDRRAKADSIPGLEILADDVRCTHGATVSNVDAEQIFYLETRGIPRSEAEKIIVSGYFEPILDSIPIESTRDKIRELINQKM